MSSRRRRSTTSRIRPAVRPPRAGTTSIRTRSPSSALAASSGGTKTSSPWRSSRATKPKPSRCRLSVPSRPAFAAPRRGARRAPRASAAAARRAGRGLRARRASSACRRGARAPRCDEVAQHPLRVGPLARVEPRPLHQLADATSGLPAARRSCSRSAVAAPVLACHWPSSSYGCSRCARWPRRPAGAVAAPRECYRATRRAPEDARPVESPAASGGRHALYKRPCSRPRGPRPHPRGARRRGAARPPSGVPLGDALGRALAEDLVAEPDLPAFDAATMDGYALRAARRSRAPARGSPWRSRSSPARPRPGRSPRAPAAGSSPARPLPEGADAVEQQEEVRRAGRPPTFRRAAERGRFVRPRGSDVARGRGRARRRRAARRRAHRARGGARPDRARSSTAGRGWRSSHRRRAGARSAARPAPGRSSRPTATRSRRRCGRPAPSRCSSRRAATTPRALARALAAGARRRRARHDGRRVGRRRATSSAPRSRGAARGSTSGGWRCGPGSRSRSAAGAGRRCSASPATRRARSSPSSSSCGPALRALAGLPGSGRLRVRGAARRGAGEAGRADVYLRVAARGVARRARRRAAPPQARGDLSSAAGLDALAILPAGAARFPRGARVEAIVLRRRRRA